MNSSYSFHCPSCGDEMKTDGNILSCPYCGNNEQLSAVNSDTEELDFNALETESVWQEPITQRCGRCGSETAYIPGTVPGPCIYCANNNISSLDKPYGVRPSMIAPFRLTSGQAAAHLDGWLKKRFLAPFPFKKELSSSSINGLYLPYWSFGANANAEYAGQAGSYYQDTEIYTSSSGERTQAKNRRVRRVRWRMVSGCYNKKFSDIIFGDVSHIDAKVIKRIEPFKLSELVKYDDRYVSGFAIERYKLGLKASWDRAKAYMGTVLRDDITAIVKRGSDVTGSVNIATEYTDISHQLLLFPIWISTYRFRNKAFNVYINGQTGEIFGESPVSILKLGIIALAAAAAAALLIWLL